VWQREREIDRTAERQRDMNELKCLEQRAGGGNTAREGGC
jgi:hypothetical protein